MLTEEQFKNLKVGDTVLYADKMDIENYGTPGIVRSKTDKHIIVLFSPKFPQAFEFTEKSACKWLALSNK